MKMITILPCYDGEVINGVLAEETTGRAALLKRNVGTG
jgi:hypothetical protein